MRLASPAIGRIWLLDPGGGGRLAFLSIGGRTQRHLVGGEWKVAAEERITGASTAAEASGCRPSAGSRKERRSLLFYGSVLIELLREGEGKEKKREAKG